MTVSPTAIHDWQHTPNTTRWPWNFEERWWSVSGEAEEGSAKQERGGWGNRRRWRRPANRARPLRCASPAARAASSGRLSPPRCRQDRERGGIKVPNESGTHQRASRCSGDGRLDLAVGETVILLHPPSTFSRCFNRDGEGASAK